MESTINQEFIFPAFGTAFRSLDDVQRGPTFIQQPYDVEVFVGYMTSVHLDCLAQGKPNPEYTWMRGNTEIDKTNQRYTLTGGRLSIEDPQEVLDTGEYSCLAHNLYGTIRSAPLTLSFASKYIVLLLYHLLSII